MVEYSLRKGLCYFIILHSRHFKRPSSFMTFETFIIATSMYNVSKNISFVPLRNRIHGIFVIIQFMVVFFTT